jgi:hypothetical protein
MPLMHAAFILSNAACVYSVPAGHQLLPVWLQDVPVVLEPAHGDSQQGGAAGSLPQLPNRGGQHAAYMKFYQQFIKQ